MSMLMFSIAVMPLIDSIGCKENYLQCWYADDSACARKQCRRKGGGGGGG